MRIFELENKLRKHAGITKSVMQAPFDLNEAIKNREVDAMSKPNIRVKRIFVIAAVLALCIITVTITPFASSMKGFFKDIVRFDGAIIGTRYENATNEIKVHAKDMVTENGSVVIPLELTFENSTEAPFAYIQEISVADYMMFDSTAGEIFRLESDPEYSGKGNIIDGKALINLSIHDVELKSGEEYTIVIEKMYGFKKADAPLHITGTWQCKFIK